MNITQESIDDLNALLKVQINQDDYQEKVNAVIQNYRKTASIPGFRKGKVPVGQIKKMHGKAILIEEVNKLIQEGIYNYITENKVEVLGNPLPLTKDVDWDHATNFDFEFEMGLSPQFEVKMTKKSKFDYLKIEADKKMLDHYTIDTAKRYGSMTHPEKSEKTDLMMGEFTQLDAEGNVLEGGIKHSASVALDVVTDKKAQKALIGLVQDDEVVIKITNKFSADLSHMLNISKEQAQELNSDFRFTVKSISRMTPAEMNQELFDKVFGKDAVKNEKEFKAKMKEEIEKSFVSESDNKLKNDVILHLIEKTKIELPDTFLKKWLVQTNEKGLTTEQVEEEYDQYSKSLKWQLIENKIIKDNELEVKHEDVIAHTKEMIIQNFAQYGQPAPDDKKLDEIAAQVLTNEEERKKVYNQLYDVKTLTLYKEKFMLKDKTVTYDEFVKLASQQ
jgi:trigger factor